MSNSFLFDSLVFFLLMLQTEESLNELQRSIHPSYAEKMMSLIQNQKDASLNGQDEL